MLQDVIYIRLRTVGVKNLRYRGIPPKAGVEKLIYEIS